jgi:hypothetical protein
VLDELGQAGEPVADADVQVRGQPPVVVEAYLLLALADLHPAQSGADTTVPVD